jgi:hypothetical protein
LERVLSIAALRRSAPFGRVSITRNRLHYIAQQYRPPVRAAGGESDRKTDEKREWSAMPCCQRVVLTAESRL